ncbi:MAG: hypothetical protein C5B48_16660 [Candidatus Rokuibacteriota bacterium]|nr:MAG: hypothetical protein C5B48_16660 [Candidatus Rokubacteria bacterium]
MRVSDGLEHRRARGGGRRARGPRARRGARAGGRPGVSNVLPTRGVASGPGGLLNPEPRTQNREPVTRNPEPGTHLRNRRTGRAIATSVELATTRRERRRGLLGRDGLAAGAAIVIAPCGAIHTAFMRFPIDAAFIDARGRVVRIVRSMGAWRIAGAWRARAVVEMAAGSLGTAELSIGDELYLESGVDETWGGAGTGSSVVSKSLRITAARPA